MDSVLFQVSQKICVHQRILYFVFFFIWTLKVRSHILFEKRPVLKIALKWHEYQKQMINQKALNRLIAKSFITLINWEEDNHTDKTKRLIILFMWNLKLQRTKMGPVFFYLGRASGPWKPDLWKKRHGRCKICGCFISLCDVCVSVHMNIQ